MTPEEIRSELYNAALEALDDDEAHKSYNPNPGLPERLREALRAWTDLEYRELLEKTWKNTVSPAREDRS